jgi:FkbM family methyltransferase
VLLGCIKKIKKILIMGEYIFKQHGVEFKFMDTENSTIPCFGWYMGVLSNGAWETDTFEIFKKVKDKNRIAIDIGGWIGSTGIWMSKNFGHVIIVEGDKNALTAMNYNLKRNGCENVTVVEKVIYSENDSEVVFGINEKTGTGLGDSMSQIKNSTSDANDYLVKTITLKKIVENFDEEKIKFIKVDIEGGEEMILEELFELSEKNKWKVWISFHYPWWKNEDIERFRNLLEKKVEIYHNNNLIPNDLFFNNLMNHQFGSFYFDFDL